MVTETCRYRVVQSLTPDQVTWMNSTCLLNSCLQLLAKLRLTKMFGYSHFMMITIWRHDNLILMSVFWCVFWSPPIQSGWLRWERAWRESGLYSSHTCWVTRRVTASFDDSVFLHHSHFIYYVCFIIIVNGHNVMEMISILIK